MPPLETDARRDLERAVVHARETAEQGARAAIAVLGVESSAAPGALSPSDRDLRTALRARGRAIGGGVLPLGVDGLVEEIAYEQWHRMLFARFLAENDLLLHPGGAAVSMAEVSALSAEEGETDQWILAARYAAAMLPGIFGADDPTHQVRFAAEHRTRLEGILTALPAALFRADDALGWVYQFWQTKRKKEVNGSGRKIGGADLPPVTQLFTEHYMVRFLLENSLGAWWAGRHPGSPLLRDWEYLRLRSDGRPAAGPFDSWPERATEITVMDPCMGSAHFLVAAADMLRKMRMEEEGLTAGDAAAAVLRDNLFGLEIDPRCTQLGAFALAFDAWKAGDYQKLPVPNIACSGMAVKGQLDDWRRLAGDDANMDSALERLYALFQDAPELGSLIDPTAAAGEGLWRVDPTELQARLEQALANGTSDPAAVVFGASAGGAAKAARLLAGRYWLVATNPPFLGSNKMSPRVREFIARVFPTSKADLAGAMLDRFRASQESGGAISFVLPEVWLQLKSFSDQRQGMAEGGTFAMVADLGPAAFRTGGGGVSVALVGWAQSNAAREHEIGLLDCHSFGNPDEKSACLRTAKVELFPQAAIVNSDGHRFTFGNSAEARGFVGDYFSAAEGLSTGDRNLYVQFFWERPAIADPWQPLANSSETGAAVSGQSEQIRWEDGGRVLEAIESARIQGQPAWGQSGVLIGRVGALRASRYFGHRFDKACVALTPKQRDVSIAPLWSFASSPHFYEAVRAIDRKTYVTTNVFTKVPFDLEHWTKVAAEQYPNGLPEPDSDDPTQWLFKGVIPGSSAPLQVAVARLLGYHWPDQEADDHDEITDIDGIVPVPPVRAEAPAAECLRVLLARAYGSGWSPALLDRLLTEAGSPGATLESWLRDDFFVQHNRLFGNRPFIWQLWDGRKDGFSVLLNYHRLDGPTLEKLTYTYLNDWIERQRARREEPAAQARLVAAVGLQTKLKQILEGEPNLDIYVRWKSLAEQPVGWRPDLDDGIRLNIRPFVTAGILRSEFTIHWKKDRGTNPDGSERRNDCHHTRAEKLAARRAT